MKLKQLLDIANKGYPDGFLEGFYDEEGKFKDGVEGDGLAKFVVCEIGETFDPKATNLAQLAEAERVIRQARIDLFGVENALIAKQAKREVHRRKG
ncbi:MAG: hypothetical protein Q7T05_02290 [Dehalococcoidia bacterium]|nr:hypothetical protein [Dehalococcoidia bacterium]